MPHQPIDKMNFKIKILWSMFLAFSMMLIQNTNSKSIKNHDNQYSLKRHHHQNHFHHHKHSKTLENADTDKALEFIQICEKAEKKLEEENKIKEETKSKEATKMNNLLKISQKVFEEDYVNNPKYKARTFPKISMSGEGKTFLKTDVIKIGVQIDTLRTTAHEALQTNAKTSNSVTNSLLGNGVKNDDIATVNFSLQPQYIWVPDPNNKDNQIKKFQGFLVSNSLEITTKKVADAGKLIDLAVDNGSQINYVSFEISPETIEMNKKALIDAAIKDAVEKAYDILDQFNYRIVEVSVISMNENSSSMNQNNDMRAKSEVSTNVFNNSREFSVNVDCVFIIEKMPTQNPRQKIIESPKDRNTYETE